LIADSLSADFKRTVNSITGDGYAQERRMAQILQFVRPTDAFGPETLIALGKAYHMALEALHDVGQPELVQEVLARRIIKAAKKGQNDPAALCAAALSAFDSDNLAR
jgi:hypothetical protein